VHPSPESVALVPGLEHLLSLTQSSDTCRGLFFNGLLEAVRSLDGEDLRTRCFKIVGERKFVDFVSYPVTDFLRGVFFVAETLGPSQGGAERVMHQLGKRGTADFLGSTVGKTMLALAGREPFRMLASVPNGCRASLSYGERSVERLDAQHARLLARRDFLPLPYNEGLLSAVLELSNARGFEVKGRRRTLLDVDYDVSWS
jgi:uncharacterized protein (TIGR02265 family)